MTQDELMATVGQNTSLKPIIDIVKELNNLPDDLNETQISLIKAAVTEAFTEDTKKATVAEISKNYDAQHLTRADVLAGADELKNGLNEFIDLLELPPVKTALMKDIFAPILEIFDEVKEQYHLYNIELPMTLEEGAQVPTYAHDTDAAADLYAAEDTVLLAHSISNMVRTGVHIQLPEGWVAIIEPRSSMGVKTGLRLSNAQGIIDSSYRGPLGVIYDNISNSEYVIHKGDRIAQMYIMPSYRFKPVVVEELTDSDRGTGGFGSSGR